MRHETYAGVCMSMVGRWNADWRFAPKQRICHSVVRFLVRNRDIIATALLCVAHISEVSIYFTNFIRIFSR